YVITALLVKNYPIKDE
ncbi:A32.5L, partial [Monkeypox virus]